VTDPMRHGGLALVLSFGCGESVDSAGSGVGGAQEHRCDLHFCESSVTVDFVGLMAQNGDDDLPLAVHVCVHGACVDAVVDGGEYGDEGCLTSGESTLCCAFVQSPPFGAHCTAAPEREVSVRIATPEEARVVGATLDVSATVTASSGQVLAIGSATATIVRSQPNGPYCEPTCYSDRIEL
jgi:hypothetical protein